MNRVFLDTGGELDPEAALKAALKGGHTLCQQWPAAGAASWTASRPGDTVTRQAPGKVAYRIALRSPVAVDHLELVYNGKVVEGVCTYRRSPLVRRSRRRLQLDAGGWLLLRAWNDGADPQVLDLYPYATTSPVYLDLPGGAPAAPGDAAYFAAWLDRVLDETQRRDDFRNARERGATLDYLREARDRYLKLETPNR